jgi:hypothetical protein
MKIKMIKDLKPGDIFKDSIGATLTVERTEAVAWAGIPGTSPKIRLYMITENKNRMHMLYNADRAVEIVKTRAAMIADAGPVDWDDYEKRVQNLEAEGMTRSDAQGVADAELMNGKAK